MTAEARGPWLQALEGLQLRSPRKVSPTEWVRGSERGTAPTLRALRRAIDRVRNGRGGVPLRFFVEQIQDLSRSPERELVLKTLGKLGWLPQGQPDLERAAELQALAAWVDRQISRYGVSTPVAALFPPAWEDEDLLPDVPREEFEDPDEVRQDHQV